MSFLLLGLCVGCGDSGGTNDAGGAPLSAESVYVLSCKIDTLVLQIPIELSFELDQPYSTDGSANLRSESRVSFGEEESSALIDAGVPQIDIISLEISTTIDGATPRSIEAALGAAPINDFDLRVDTNDDGIPGPHRLELDPVSVATTLVEGAEEVLLALELDQISMVLGDFEVPADCLSPTLAGVPARFPTGAKGNPSEDQQPQQR